MYTHSPLSVEIAGLGSYVPRKILTNEDLQNLVETSDEWITQRTGIKQRRLVADEEATSDLATAAAREALRAAELSPSDLQMILVATCTPDHLFPATGCLVQAALGAHNAMACDLEAACSGFVYAFVHAAAMIDVGALENALIIGAESLSRFTDYTDRRSCILFGDGAGAAVLKRRQQGRGVLYAELGADGSDPSILVIPAGGSRLPASEQTVEDRLHYMKLKGREVFRWAVNKLTELMLNIPERTGVSLDEIKVIIPHQSNVRIIKSACERAGVPLEKAYMNIERFGNTSAASIPVAMDEALRRGVLRRGDIVLLLAFGGGVTWASLLFEY